ncbi:MAG: NAD(P)/FAD-dependent oxidoreductase [bacterium]
MSGERTIPKLNDSYDIVVIGAGNGGLAAALQIAVKGGKPLLLEQHNLPGGFATSFVRGRFEFEASLHELAGIGPASDKGGVRAFLEDECKVDIDWVPVPEAYRLILTDDNLDITLPFGVQNYIEAIELEVPGSREPMNKYIELCRDLKDTIGLLGKLNEKPDITKLAESLKNLPAAFGDAASMPVKIGNFMKTLAYTVDEVTKTFNIPAKAMKILYPYWCYLGLPTSRMSFTIWAVMLLEYLERGAYIPRMRSHELASAMEARILELGGQVEYNTRVEKIIVENNQVAGVETASGDVIKTQHVICNASPTLAYNKLISPISAVPPAAYKNVNARKHGGAGFVVYLGLNAPMEEIGIRDYGLFISKNMDTDDIYFSMGKAALNNMQATICLNNAIPYCSPPGTSIISMTTLYKSEAWHTLTPGDYFKLKNKIASDMIDQFEKATHTRIRDHIEEIEVATPVTFARYTGTHGGGVYGYEPEPWDSVIPRILSQKDECYIKGLMFTGGYSQMCHGYSSALMSGQATAGAALRKMGVK